MGPPPSAAQPHAARSSRLAVFCPPNERGPKTLAAYPLLALRSHVEIHLDQIGLPLEPLCGRIRLREPCACLQPSGEHKDMANALECHLCPLDSPLFGALQSTSSLDSLNRSQHWPKCSTRLHSHQARRAPPHLYTAIRAPPSEDLQLASRSRHITQPSRAYCGIHTTTSPGCGSASTAHRDMFRDTN